MKPETEIRNLRRELRGARAERDEYERYSRKWKAAHRKAREDADEWKRLFAQLLQRMPKTVE